MDIKEEMLEIAGIYKKKNTITGLITEGLYFNSNLNRELKNAVSNKIITNKEAVLLKEKSENLEEAVDFLFDNLIPRAEKALEEGIEKLEESIENSVLLEESEQYEDKINSIKERLERVRNI